MHTLLRDCYASDVPTKIALSRQLHERFGPHLEADAKFRGILAEMVQLVVDLDEVMRGMQLFVLCGACGSQPSGGCCSAEMANETDAILLWMNLLAGRQVTAVRDDGFECCFLGTAGCSLLFKPMFCLNYNCEKIKKGSGLEKMRQLEQGGGRLLQAQYAMEQFIHGILGASLQGR